MKSSKNHNVLKTDGFEVKDSLTVLLIIFVVASLFAILLCYYPGKAFLKGNFWPMFALPALLAAGCLFKIITRKAILKMDAFGLKFSRSGIAIAWKDIYSATLLENNFEGEDEDYLNLKYRDPGTDQLLETNFPIVSSLNKTPAQIMEAIVYFRKPPDQSLEQH